MQGLPKSHVGPKGYRHVNISAITYEPHCEPCHTTIANRWRHRIGNITNTNIFVFKQSGLKDVYNTLFFFFFSLQIFTSLHSDKQSFFPLLLQDAEILSWMSAFRGSTVSYCQ